MFCFLLSTTPILAENQSQEEFDINNQLGVDKFLTLSGQLGIYSRDTYNNDDSFSDSDFKNAYSLLTLETIQWNNLQLGVSGAFTGQLDNDSSYSDSVSETKALLSELYLKYTYSETTITLGRSLIDWVFLGQFYEGVFIESNDLPGFNVRAAWAHNTMQFDPDGTSRWEEIISEDDTSGLKCRL